MSLVSRVNRPSGNISGNTMCMGLKRRLRTQMRGRNVVIRAGCECTKSLELCSSRRSRRRASAAASWRRPSPRRGRRAPCVQAGRGRPRVVLRRPRVVMVERCCWRSHSQSRPRQVSIVKGRRGVVPDLPEPELAQAPPPSAAGRDLLARCDAIGAAAAAALSGGYVSTESTNLRRTGPNAHATPLGQTCCDASLSLNGISQVTMANAFAVVRL